MPCRKKDSSLVWAGAVGKREQTDVGVDSNRAGVKKVAAAAVVAFFWTRNDASKCLIRPHVRGYHTANTAKIHFTFLVKSL